MSDKRDDGHRILRMQHKHGVLTYVYLLSSISLLLMSCAKSFQPVAPSYMFWSKPGKSELDVKKAMLECGKPSPDPTIEMYRLAYGLYDDERLNYYILTNKCMELSGYTGKHVSSYESCMRYPERRYLSSCQPDTKIPKPSIERRLNSWYCKLKTDYQYCLKHAVNPPACNPEGYKNPPPECLP